MADDTPAQTGPDLTKGVAPADLTDGKLVGHVGDDAVLLVQAGPDIFAVGAHCSHYHGPLGDGLVVGTSVRCPWHHACFDLHNGEAVRAPALSSDRLLEGRTTRRQDFRQRETAATETQT